MIAKLWAQYIINGKKNFNDVPRLLKEEVKSILTERGYSNLITE